MNFQTIVAASAACVVLTGSAFAQQYQRDQGGRQLGDREVRQFVSGLERDVNQMVQSGDLSRLRQWTQDNVADHAVLSRTNSIETERHSRVMSSVTITKPDLMRLQRFVFGGLSERLGNLDDFRLDIQVMNVEPVGDSAAIVKTRVTQRATLAARHREGGPRTGEEDDRDHDFTTGQGPHPETQGGDDFEEGQQRHGHRSHQGSVRIESEATCTHLIERSRDAGHLQIGMGVCDATTQAQL